MKQFVIGKDLDFFMLLEEWEQAVNGMSIAEWCKSFGELAQESSESTARLGATRRTRKAYRIPRYL